MSAPETPAVAYCRVCGKPLAPADQRLAGGTVYCQDHVPATPPGPSPYTAPPPTPASPGGDVSPGLAFLLGLIPGVGAIYNAQYAKGLMHLVIFGLLISIVNSNAADGLEPLFGVMIPGWFFYMAFEAYHTAKKRQLGQPVDEFSSIVPLRRTGFPVAPVLLITVGVLFLLSNLDIIRLAHLIRYWPVFLIALGVYMLYARMSGNDAPAAAPEASHERQ